MAGFQLEVTFTGLNLFVVDKDNRVAVLQPDARVDDTRPSHMQHADRSEGIPHVGYLRFDLGNLVTSVATGDPPRGEGIYRFNRQTLHFGLGDDPVAFGTLALPDFARIADAEILPDLFSPAPADPPVMRTLLSGGTVAGKAGSTFVIPQVLNAPGSPRYEYRFATEVTWTRTVAADALKLTLHGFPEPGTTQAAITLKPVEDVIRLRIANLCSVDPLEWTDDFETEEIAQDDQDFKWVYRLLRLRGGMTYEDKLLGSPLPIPRFVRAGAGVENCIGAVIRDQAITVPVTDRRES